jgi:segregation and condensation protein B
VNSLTQLLEAALFSAAHPLSAEELARLQPDASREDLLGAIEELRQHYEEHRHGVELIEVADGYQVVTRPHFADAVADAQFVRRPRRLSRAALETLVLRTLLERGIVEVVGRGEGLGRPLLYGTTRAFLELLGLNSRDDLPKLEEMSVALRPLGEQSELAGT